MPTMKGDGRGADVLEIVADPLTSNQRIFVFVQLDLACGKTAVKRDQIGQFDPSAPLSAVAEMALFCGKLGVCLP